MLQISKPSRIGDVNSGSLSSDSMGLKREVKEIEVFETLSELSFLIRFTLRVLLWSSLLAWPRYSFGSGCVMDRLVSAGRWPRPTRGFFCLTVFLFFLLFLFYSVFNVKTRYIIGVVGSKEYGGSKRKLRVRQCNFSCLSLPLTLLNGRD